MKPPAFDYEAPATLADAVRLLAADPEAKALAGGQSLVPLLSFRLATPTTLVDLARIDGLAGIARENGHVRIGAMTRQADLEESAEIAASCPLLLDAVRHVAHPQIRSRGTVGGSVAHADPAAELPAALLALGGRVHAEGPDGARTIDATAFFEGFFTTALGQGEILTALEIPVAPPRTGAACVEVARRHGDYALVGALAQVTLADDGSVARAGLALIGVGPTPVRASAAEAALAGRAPERVALEEAAAAAVAGLKPGDDVHATSSYRRHTARVVARRALEAAIARAA